MGNSPVARNAANHTPLLHTSISRAPAARFREAGLGRRARRELDPVREDRAGVLLRGQQTKESKIRGKMGTKWDSRDRGPNGRTYS